MNGNATGPDGPARSLKLEEVGAAEARAWDQFAEAHPLGQIQQSPAWGEAKRADGWKPLIVAAREGGSFIAGAQILWKDTRFGRLGFLNKGPLWKEEAGLNASTVIRALDGVIRTAGLRALIAQGPDGLRAIEGDFERAGWMPERLLQLIDSTLLVDLSPGWEGVKKAFRRTVRRQVFMAEDRGVTITDGGEEDVPHFFTLMCKTCEVQGTRPNPGSVEAMMALWRALAREGRVRVHFAVLEGRKIAGGLSFTYNGRVTFWKKGWDQTRTDTHPNTLLTWDVARWGAERGFQWLDFVSLDRDLAELMEAGKDLPEDVTKRRDFFNLGFGGRGRVLPRAYIRFANPVFAVGYRIATSGPLRDRARRMLRRLSVG